MPSSKGKPTDPKLREEVVEDVKNETNKDGSGKGQMAAWKGAKIAKEYEAKGGDYENAEGSKNKPKKGTPEAKDGDKEENGETVEAGGNAEASGESPEVEKPKITTGKKAGKGAGEKKAPKAKKEKVNKEPTRVSSRQAAMPKRKTPEEEDDEEEAPAKPVAKKAKPAPDANGDKKSLGRGRPKKAAEESTSKAKDTSEKPAANNAKGRGRPKKA